MPLPSLIEIVPLTKPVHAEITVPGSKSITNRALILAALFKGLGWAGFSTMLGFIATLIVALVYCWKKGALEWES